MSVQWPADTPGSVSHRYGVYLTASHIFGEPGGDAFGVGWRRQLGAFAPAVELGVVRSGAHWGYALSQRLDYENRRLLVRQEYRYDSLQAAQQLEVRVSARQLEPFGVSGALSVSRVAGVLRYDLAGQATYRPDDHFSVSLQANSGSDGFRARLSALKQWQVGASDVYLGGQADSALGVTGGALQLTAVIPREAGQVLLSGLVGYGGGFFYGAGAGYVRGPFSVAGGVQGDPASLRATLSAAYRPERGLYGTADYLLSRSGQGSRQDLRGSAGYAGDLWSAGLLAGYSAAQGQPGHLVYGVSAAGQLWPNLQLQARAERSAERTRFTVGVRFTPAGTFRTPDALVGLFGGRNAGTLKLQAFNDLNNNGTRDAGEPGVASQFQVGGQTVTTTAQGEASLLLNPGSYDVQLGGEVLAQYLMPNLPAVSVKLRDTVSLSIPVREIGSVQGRLTDDGGRPVVGAQVNLNGPGGTLSVQADPALYQAPPAVSVTLDTRQALITHDAVLKGLADISGLEADGLSLDVILPAEALPPGATLPIRVEVEPAAEAVSVEGLGLPVQLSSSDGKTWAGTLTLPADQQTALEVQVVARQGPQSSSERALLLVDAGLPFTSLRVAPYNALPGQVMTLRAVSYSAGSRVQVRDEQGHVTDLKAGGGRDYLAEFTAPATPGNHTLTLLVDGQARSEATYQILGRP